MKTELEALDTIAYLIYVEASIKEQTRWLKKAIEEGLVDDYYADEEEECVCITTDMSGKCTHCLSTPEERGEQDE